MLKDTKMRFFTTIVSFILMTNTLFGSDTILWYPVKSVNQLRKATIILPYKTESELSKNKLVQFEGNLGQQLDDHFHPIINNNSASLEIDNYFCTSVTLLFSKVLFSSHRDLYEQLTFLHIPNPKEDLSNIELAVPPPGDCPLLEALAKDLADPDKGPALNAYLDELLTEGSVRVKAWEKWIDFPTLRKNVGVLEIVQDWSESLILRFKNAGSKHPDFHNKVNTTPAIANYFEEGFPIIKSNGSGLKEVELDMYAWDRSRINREPNRPQLFDEPNNPTSYIENTTKVKYNNLHNNVDPQSGIIKDNDGIKVNTDNVNGEGLMYAVDNSGVIHIGGRGGDNSFAHPNLIGGINPNIKCAGMIKFNQGKILEITNKSGHFKPSAANLEQIKSIFQNKFPLNSTNSGTWDNIFINVAN